jgi:molybdate transport system ATP-binding protein
LLLDEPLGALDLALRERIVPWLLRLRASWRVPVVWVTHQVGEALALADAVLLIRDGRLVAEGPPAELLDVAAGDERDGGVENLFDAVVADHDHAGGITHVRLGGTTTLSVPLHAGRLAGAHVTCGVRAEDVLVATAPVKGLSARNVLEAVVVDVTRLGADALLRAAPAGGGPPWLVRLTPAAVSELALEPGRRVWLAVKSHSVRVA